MSELLMIRVDECVTILTREVDLIYSPDDEAETGKGYYLVRQRPAYGQSKMFATERDALKAFASGRVRFVTR
jgi:hypothetical protein